MAKKRRKHRKHKSSTKGRTHRKRRHGRRRRKGFGSIVTFRTTGAGMGALESGVMLPLLAGGGFAALVTTLIRRMMPMSDGSSTGRMVVKFAPVLGAGAGILSSLAYAMATKNKRAGDYGVAASLVVGTGLMIQDFGALKSRAGDITAALHGIGAVMPELRGIGALVMENVGPGMHGVTMLESAAHGRPDSLGRLGSGMGSPYGAQLGVSGIDQGAFGTKTF